MYRLTTRSIEVTVEPFYMAEESHPEEDQYFWAYTVAIHNKGSDRVQLRYRHWKIIDGTGNTQEVRGAGVVGEEPVIEPGGSFQYTSGCPLNTPSGIMSGDYKMQKDDGEYFEVEIPAFSLDLPNAKRTLN
ncbi:Co2+/Mg2+ efflux protein ApaG [Rhodobacteraceae bacterium RKSG542]|uniref:Co2+/Mg2+ efflux protein ApaG n=1 Tax=Pseudovibrio flavus TaxID=2529854 RepID=UPI0012BD0AB4|nr:Co2+/Mg2+ efflux protein ApaG [Pseudovibrio flavus]MTI18784.1 Co2+/Mg2+ efflux protein ApaG [Pseudovibrio flavus]